MNKRIKLFATKAVSIDEATKSVTVVISDNKEDRYGEIVDQKSWNFKDFMKNPIVLWGHNPEEPENVLGTASSLEVAPDGSQTTAKLSFDDDINPKAALVFNQIKKGTLRTVSVGFVPHTEEYLNDTPVLKDNDLLEISVVPIPANPRAVALGFKAGELNRKDAQWLLDSMRKEADLIEEHLKEDNERETKSMTEEQAKALLDSMTQLTESVAAIQEKQTAMEGELAKLSDVDTNDDAADDDTDADADASNDDNNDNDTNNNTDDSKDDDSANDGDNDQSGAEDEFDENAELTPEQEAEMDQLLADKLAELEPVA